MSATPNRLRLIALGLLAVSGHAMAIVTDTGSVPALPPSLDVSGVGQLSNGCSSVLLAGGRYLLASGHCAAAPGGTVSFLGGGVTASITGTVFEPNYDGVALNDLSISRLATPVTGVAGYAIGTLGLPGTVVLAGYGISGSGASGASGPAGTLRYGMNEYEYLVPDEPDGTPPVFLNGTLVAFDFDDASRGNNRFGSSGLAGEAMVASGDSGGPSFALISGEWRVVGIHSGYEPEFGFGFGAIGYDQLLSPYGEWIAKVISARDTSTTGFEQSDVPYGAWVTAVPEPASTGLWLAGLLGVWGWQRANRTSLGAR